jgi:hypothetical protein
MDESRKDNISQVFVEENNLLTTEYSAEEVWKAIFQMEYNKAPGPDGFLVEFYQIFWETIKSDFLDLFSCLHAGQVELFLLIFGEINFIYLRLMRLKGSNNIDQFSYLMLVLKFSRRWPP